LDMGFLPDIQRVLDKVPSSRQTLMLSATMPPSIRNLATDILNKPVSVEVARVSAPAENIDHWAYRVEKKEKPALLSSVLDHTPYSRALVFTRTKHGADKVVRHLMKSGVSSAAIHGNKSQNARTRALADFRSGKTGVLVATDIAARGLDIDNISHVINYDLTDEPETYVHRIGRTARAGATGTALSFVSGDDRGHLRAIERLICTQLQPAADIPGYVAPKVLFESVRHDSRSTSRPRGDNRRQRNGFSGKNAAHRKSRHEQRGPRKAVSST
jgi:ATP-dependent RNA helicase RhlE